MTLKGWSVLKWVMWIGLSFLLACQGEKKEDPLVDSCHNVREYPSDHLLNFTIRWAWDGDTYRHGGEEMGAATSIIIFTDYRYELFNIMPDLADFVAEQSGVISTSRVDDLIQTLVEQIGKYDNSCYTGDNCDNYPGYGLYIYRETPVYVYQYCAFAPGSSDFPHGSPFILDHQPILDLMNELVAPSFSVPCQGEITDETVTRFRGCTGDDVLCTWESGGTEQREKELTFPHPV